jgi:radical SAM superfamily enzyme YgiQ (UPF0313 family)
MNRKVYYIQPSYRKMDGKIVKGWTLFNASLNLPMLSAATPRHWEKSFCLEYFDDINYKTDASVVFLTSMSYDIRHSLEIAKRFKDLGKIVIFGGHTDKFTDTLMRSVCDAVFYGIPDTKALESILEDADSGIFAPEYNCGFNLNFPFDYSVFGDRKFRHLPVLAGVGCSHTCDYCCYPLTYNGKYYLRKIRHVIADLRSVRGQTGVAAFKDANIYNNRKYLHKLCSEIIRENINLRWGAQCTIDIGDDPEILTILRQAGCRLLFIGFESMNQKNLEAVRKPFDVSRFHEWVKQIRKAGIHVVGYFMLGLDNDTPDSFEDIFSFVHDSRITLPLLNMLIPIPGTRIFDRLKAEGRLSIPNEKEFLEKNPLYSVPCNRALFTPRMMSRKELEQGFLDLSRRLSTYREIIRRSRVTNPLEALQIFKMNLDLRKEHRKMESFVHR